VDFKLAGRFKSCNGTQPKVTRAPCGQRVGSAQAPFANARVPGARAVDAKGTSVGQYIPSGYLPADVYEKSKTLRFKASRFRALAVTLSACSRVREGECACQVLVANSNADTRYTDEDSRSSWGLGDPERDWGSGRPGTEAWRDGRYREPGQPCALLQHCAHYDVTPLILQQFPSAPWAPRPPPHQLRFPAPAHIAYARARQ
jgi:hypothetical protein